MDTSLLFSTDIMSAYSTDATSLRQPSPRSLPITHLHSSKHTSANDLNHWLSRQQLEQSWRSNTQVQTMSSNGDSYPSGQHHGVVDAQTEYTFTTHPPNDDFSLWSTHQPDHYPGMQLTIQPTTHVPRFTPSPIYSDAWDYQPYNESSEHASNSQTFLSGGTYSPESQVGILSPFNIQQRTLPQLSPTMSDPCLSPLYSPSPGLLTPSTPDSSPTLSEMNHLVVFDNQPTNENGNKPLFTHREQQLKFREALSLPAADGAGPFLPQQMYKPHTTSDRKRYVEEVLLEAPLYFGSEHHQHFGILLKDALHSRTKKLHNRDQVVFEGRGPSVSIRLEWPGYRQWSRQIPTKDFRSPPQPITLAKLAKNVAKCVQRFMQDRKSIPMEEDADQRWRIGDGPDDIKLEDLMLVSIHHVSLGSWQPHLRLVRPLANRARHSHSPMPSMLMPPMTASNASPSNISFSLS